MHIEVNGVRLFFEVCGTKLQVDGARMIERPTVVMLHGGPGMSDHSVYRPEMDSLADIAQVIMLDHRGNGRSDGDDPTDWTLEQWGDDVWAFCNALGIHKPIIMGNSFGGMVALSYAVRHPTHPGKLILSSTSARGLTFYAEQSIAMFRRLGGEEVGLLAEAYFGGDDGPELYAAWVQKAFPHYTRNLKPNPESMFRTVVRMEVAGHFLLGQAKSYDLLPQLASLACPTLLLAGELDPMCPVEASDEMAARIPESLLTYRRYADSGHAVYKDALEAMGHIREFILA